MKIQPPPTVPLLQVPPDLQRVLDEIAETLRKSMRTLAVAEDGFTGGLAATLLSTTCNEAILRRSWLLQDEQSKMEEVAVQRATIETFGAASEAVAIEMALGARRNAGCNYGLGVSGFVDEQRRGSVGRAWISISHGSTQSVEHHELRGTRLEMASISVVNAIQLLHEAVTYF